MPTKPPLVKRTINKKVKNVDKKGKTTFTYEDREVKLYDKEYKKAKQPHPRKTRAISRVTEAQQRSPQEQLKRLDDLLGKDCGAIKERAKLAQKIKEMKNKKHNPEKKGK